VFDLILSHLEPVPPLYATDPHAESAQRELGYRMQRVCPAWLIGGRRIAWSRFTYFWNADDDLINGLLERPNFAGEIRELSYQYILMSEARGPTASIRRRRDATLKVVELIEMCSARLETLSVQMRSTSSEVPIDWARIFSSTMASTLRSLSIRVSVGSEEVLVKLVRGLAAFTNLRRLILSVHGSSQWQPRARGADVQPVLSASRLPVETLILDHWGEGPPTLPILTGELLTALLDTAKTRDLTLSLSGHKIDDLAWLGAFDHLEVVDLAASPDAEPLKSQIPFFVEGIASLPALQTVYISPLPREDLVNRTDLAPSPVSLGRLLIRMPPRIKRYTVGGGVFFVEDVGLPTVALEHRPRPDVRLVLSLKLKGTEKARPVELSRRTNTNGVKIWSIVPPVRFLIPLLHQSSTLEADSLARACRTPRSAATRRPMPDAVELVRPFSPSLSLTCTTLTPFLRRDDLLPPLSLFLPRLSTSRVCA